MADTRQHYHGWVARKWRRGVPCVRRQNAYYWWMTGRAWFWYLRKAPKIGGRMRLVFDHPMAQHRKCKPIGMSVEEL